MNNLIGTMLGQRYEILEQIGIGGMAVVYKAKCHLLNRFVAIKVLKDEFKRDDEFLKKFEKESQSAAQLSHPNIVNVFDVGKEDDINYIVMELIKGQTLKSFIKKREGFLPNNAIIKISKQIASALEQAHMNKIIHRDIKPQNIMIDEHYNVKVADFGIARAVNSSTIVNTKDAMGSVHYSSPEQARGGFVTEASDIYSLGIVMYELATKSLPYTGDSAVTVALKHMEDSVEKPSNINAGINKGLESVILKAIQKDPTVRYQTASELIDDLAVLERNMEADIPLYVFDEESPTMILPNLEGYELVEEPMAKKKKAKKKQNNSVKTLLAILAALILSLILFTVVSFNAFNQRVINPPIVVPNLVGMNIDSAKEAMLKNGIFLEVENTRQDEVFAKDVILTQNMNEGEQVKEGFTIKVTVSEGPSKVTVPNMINKSLTEARVKLDNLGLKVGSIKYEFSELEKEFVISQEVNPGTEVEKNSTVDLVISQGPESTTVIVPSVLGRTVDDAIDLLGAIELTIENVTYEFSEEVEADLIISQTVEASTEVETGTTMDVVVSKGIDPETVEPEIDPTLSYRTFHIPMDFEGESEVVKIVVIQTEVAKTVYETTHQKTEGTITVNVPANPGDAIVNVYFGTSLYHSAIYNFK